jgi:hypothetical protein
VGQMTRNDCCYRVRRYLRWLEKRELAGPLGAEELDGYNRKPLPDEVRRFLQFLPPTRRPSTVNGYRYVLRRFHRWLGDQNFAITNFDHSVCLAWSQELHERGIHPTTRFCWLVSLRTYLNWLCEHGLIAAPGRALILSRDLPKKPDYLPRPLPPEIDQELQRRLKQAGTTVTLGLLVMRRTGLRVGEDNYVLVIGLSPRLRCPIAANAAALIAVSNGDGSLAGRTVSLCVPPTLIAGSVYGRAVSFLPRTCSAT